MSKASPIPVTSSQFSVRARRRLRPGSVVRVSVALKPVTPTMLDAGSETQADEDQVSDEAYDNDCERDGDCKT